MHVSSNNNNQNTLILLQFKINKISNHFNEHKTNFLAKDLILAQDLINLAKDYFRT